MYIMNIHHPPSFVSTADLQSLIETIKHDPSLRDYICSLRSGCAFAYYRVLSALHPSQEITSDIQGPIVEYAAMLRRSIASWQSIPSGDTPFIQPTIAAVSAAN